jgi:hypothetical protein
MNPLITVTTVLCMLTTSAFAQCSQGGCPFGIPSMPYEPGSGYLAGRGGYIVDPPRLGLHPDALAIDNMARKRQRRHEPLSAECRTHYGSDACLQPGQRAAVAHEHAFGR